jgi:RNA polymerase-binding protein DksA
MPRKRSARKKAVKKKGTLKKSRVSKKKAGKRAARGARKKTRRTKAKKFSKTDLMEFKKLLLKEREKIMGEMKYLTKDALKKSQKDISGDLSGYSYHMADVATDNYDREFSLGLASNEQKQVYKIDDALKRLEDGSYGTCLECGRSISKRRLKIIPQAYFCIKCQGLFDSKR